MELLLRLAAVALVAAAFVAADGTGTLSPSFYDATCPGLQPAVRRGVAQAVKKEARMGASLLRLFFHDCFVQGCDASILLDDTANFTGEKSAAPNANSLRGYEVIDAIKAEVEASCKATVSCADIVALAARDAVNLLGGPSWPVLLGRRDALMTTKAAAEDSLPSPTSRLPQLLHSFSKKGLNARDLVALSGAHSVGMAHCSNFREHVYKDTKINMTYAAQLRAKVCPFVGGDDNLAPLELQKPDKFDNGFFNDVITGQVLLRTDQELLGSSGSHGTTDALVREYAANADRFAAEFAMAMIKLGNMAVQDGEVRLNCRRPN
ncbi:peroxidase P7-like [Lolium rigidum]|uniref:peroxidase P7-like n=1 Tax=Lolium rigidum TaxID=89674 RepID=UPI001F5D74F8|nr:peroxidase P7-like [Lolium rigidum]XP_051212684.1 peroxidase P7-like [Lolium perenne]